MHDEPATALPDFAEQLIPILDSISYTVVVLDADARVVYLNDAGERLVGRRRAQVVGQSAVTALPEIFGANFASYRARTKMKLPAQFDEHHAPLGLWVELNACPSPCGLMVCARDVTSRNAHDRIMSAQKNVLEMVATGAPLEPILRAITTLVEQQSPGDICSILRLDDAGQRMHAAACGSLPAAFSQAIEGLEIGPSIGSCGTAAYTRSRVIVSDIATDPRWAGFANIAIPLGLRACWSQPILSRDGRRVLGTVANYSRTPRQPTEHSLQLLETAAHLSQIAIEQSQSDEKLRRHALAFDNALDGIVIAGADGQIVDWNPVAELMFGYGRVGAGQAQGIHPGEANQPSINRDVFQTVKREGQWRGEIQFDRPDGTRSVCDSVVVGLTGDDGQMIAAVGVNHDITDRKHAETRLKTEVAVAHILTMGSSIRETIPQLLETICVNCDWEAGALWTVEPDNSAIRCSDFWHSASSRFPEFERATRDAGFTSGVGLPGRVWATARPNWVSDVRADGNFPRQAFAIAAGLRGALAFPVLLDGRVIAVMEFFATVLREPDATLDAMFTVMGGEVGNYLSRAQALDELRAATQSLDKANRAKDRFFAMLSHELRTPLSPALLIASSLAEDPTLPPEIRDDGAMIRRNIELQTRLIDDLLDVSRIENARLIIDVRRVDLHDLLHDSVLICAADAKSRGVRIATELRATRRMVPADPMRLRQVACNLLKNAIKFTPAGGSVRVRSADAPDDEHRVHFSVIDTGIGIAADMLPRIFNPFEQIGRASQSKGLGLGLTICKGITDAHEGRIWAQSQGLGHGSTITVELPALGASRADEIEPVQPVADPHPSPLRILLVDDHQDTLRAMSRLLRKLEHKVITADCVRAALDVAIDHDFDLLISDVGLPDGTGIQLLKELVRRRPVRGIALTGYGSEGDIRQTHEAGFSAHLTKPIGFAQLCDAITRCTQ
jgi:PAS domain S-box-containing protein